jgi:hypothetical protein
MAELRTTSGQRISIGYDPTANTLIFQEEGWHAEAFRNSEAPPAVRQTRPIGSVTMLRLRAARQGNRVRLSR